MPIIKQRQGESSRRGLLLIDAQEVARRLGFSLRTVRRLAAEGKLSKPISIGGKSKRWRLEDIKAWVAAGCPDQSILEAARHQRAMEQAAEMGEVPPFPALPQFSGWYSKAESSTGTSG